MMIFKKWNLISIIFFIMLSANSATVFAQIDSVAIAILDSMSDVVTNLESCSFNLKIENDVYDLRLGIVEQSDESSVFLKAPDKFFIKRKGDRGNKEFYYDGKSVTYYSADNNQYASAPAPPTILETIDSIQNEFGVEFPASDIFYPDLVDQIMENSNNLVYLGITSIGGKLSHHIAGTNAEFTYQLWISADGTPLPLKMAIAYANKTGSPQYEAMFDSWVLNPVLQDSMFNFSVPEGATKIKLLKKNNN
jgi:hypothetical protein